MALYDLRGLKMMKVFPITWALPPNAFAFGERPLLSSVEDSAPGVPKFKALARRLRLSPLLVPFAFLLSDPTLPPPLLLLVRKPKFFPIKNLLFFFKAFAGWREDFPLRPRSVSQFYRSPLFCPRFLASRDGFPRTLPRPADLRTFGRLISDFSPTTILTPFCASRNS